MKKTFIILLMLGGLFAACDMDKKPYGSLDDQTAIQTLNDCERFRNGLYGSMRSLTSGDWIIYQEIQADLFQGLINNGNQAGEFSNALITPSSQDVTSMWGSIYGVINSANYIIEKMDGLVNSGAMDEDNLLMLKRYEGEARFVRAFGYWWLADHFCEPYSSATADAAAKGLPLVTKYFPTANRAVYPGRSTQNESYKLIEDDLGIALSALQAYEAKAGAPAPEDAYLSSYAVMAMQARVALMKGDNATALKKAEDVIGSGVYALTEIADYKKLWKDDKSTEIIFRPFMSNTELGGATGGRFQSNTEETAEYLPTYSMLVMYEDEDVRFDNFFGLYKKLKVNGETYPAYVFTKFPGNKTLQTSTTSPNNFVNMTKPFRLSEMYLVAAEAAASTDAQKANKYLNGLRAKRIEGYTDVTLSGDNLVQAIRDERLKELIGEGFRLSDLRRWGVGFERDGSYPANPNVESIFVRAGKDMAYKAGDHRYVWPIPTKEMASNPQLDGQQNPGY